MNLMQAYGEAMDLHQVLFVSPMLFETTQQFEQRLRSMDLFLQRCSADIANISQFIDLCPPSASAIGAEMPLECELQLQQLQARLLKDVKTKRNDAGAWTEWVRYNDYVAGVDSANAGTNTVAAVTAMVRSHISRHRIAERVQEFVQEQLDALSGNTLFDEVPGDSESEQRSTTEYALLRAYAAASMVTAWLQRLADFASGNRAACMLLLGTPALLLFLYKVLGRKSVQKLHDAIREADGALKTQEKKLAGLFVENKSLVGNAITLADMYEREIAPEQPLASDNDDGETARLLAENEAARRELERLAKRLAKMKKSRAEWQTSYAALSSAVEAAMTGGHNVVVTPALREQYLQHLSEQRFDLAETLVHSLLHPRAIERSSVEMAKRFVARNPQAWQQANELVYGSKKERAQAKRIEKQFLEQKQPALMKQLIASLTDDSVRTALASVPLLDDNSSSSSSSSSSLAQV